METTTDVSVPAQNLAYYLASALHAMDYEDSEEAFRKLQYGTKLDVDGDVVTVCFADGSSFISMSAADLLVPPPSVQYHVNGVTLG